MATKLPDDFLLQKSSEQRSVCVFCASSIGINPVFLAAAKTLGRSVAERGWRLVYGGADVGLMGALADAALAHGGAVTASFRESWWSVRLRIAA